MGEDSPMVIRLNLVEVADGTSNPLGELRPSWIVSPCVKRPDTGAPCILSRREKNNSICLKCYYIHGGPVKTLADIQEELLKPREVSIRTNKREQPNGLTCQMPWCDSTARFGAYCSDCNRIVKDRKLSWARTHNDGSEPPEEVLHRMKKIVKRKNPLLEGVI